MHPNPGKCNKFVTVPQPGPCFFLANLGLILFSIAPTLVFVTCVKVRVRVRVRARARVRTHASFRYLC